MKNFKRLLAITLTVVMVFSMATTAMAATKNDDKALTLYKLGLFNGVSTTAYEPALEDEADATQAIALIGRALQWDIDEDAEVAFTDVPEWAVPYVAYAVDKGITNGVSATEFGVDIISGKRVVTWTLRALGYDMEDSWNFTEAFATTAGISVPETSLRDDVVGVIYDTLKTTPVSGSKTLIESIVDGDDALEKIALDAGLMMPSELGIKSVEVVGLKVLEVQLSDSVDSEDTEIEVKKGAAKYSNEVEWNDDEDTATVTTLIKFQEATYTINVITDDETYTYDLVITDNDEDVASIKITTKGISDEDAAAEIDFVVYNQFGEDMEIESNDTGFSVSAYNITQSDSVTSQLDQPDETYFTIDTSEDEDQFEDDDEVRFTITYKGVTEQKTLTIMEQGEFSTIDFGDIVLEDDDTSLDEEDDTFILEYELRDQYGDKVYLDATSSVATLTAEIEDIQFISSDTDVVDGIQIVENDDDEGEIVFSIEGEGTTTITAIINSSGEYAQATIEVNASSEPEAVSIDGPSDYVAAGDDYFDLEMVITDQYGDTITSISGLNIDYDFDADDDDVTITAIKSDGETFLRIDLSEATVTDDEEELEITIEDDDDNELGSIAFEVQPNAVATSIDDVSFPTSFEYDGTDGAEITVDEDDIEVVDQYGREYEGTIVITSEDEDILSVDDTTLTAESIGDTTIEITVEDATLEVDIEVIEPDDIDEYTMDDIDLIYAPSSTDADYQVEVILEGLDGSGDTVALIDSMPDFITTSDASTASVSGNVITGEDAGTVTIGVWVNGDEVDTQKVKVSEEDPYAVSIEFTETDLTSGDDLDDYIVIEDQYDVEIEVSLYFSVDDDDYDVNSNNELEGPDGSVDVTVVTPNGVSITETITLD